MALDRLHSLPGSPDHPRLVQEHLDAPTESLPAPDVCLLLRAHAEQLWLSREVIPVLRQLETPDASLPEEQLGAAFAYLEVIWVEATRHTRETEAVRELCEPTGVDNARAELSARAHRYYEAVRNLREVVSVRVQRLLTVAPS